jgi:hypothetical protein
VIAALERAGGAAQGETAAFAPGKETGASWPGAAKGNEQPAAGNESFKANWQSMLRAWGSVARTSGMANQAASEGDEIGEEDGSSLQVGAPSAPATFARAEADAAPAALTTNRSNAPMTGVAAPISNAARAIRLQSLVNAASLTPTVAASAQSATAIRAATGSGSSRGVSAGANVKSERRASGEQDSGAQQQVPKSSDGVPVLSAHGAGLAAPMPAPAQIPPTNLGDSLASGLANLADDLASAASGAETQTAVAGRGAAGAQWTTVASTATNSSASARAASPAPAIPAPASAAQSTQRGEETSGGTTVPLGEQEEFAALPQASLTAAAIAAAGALRAGSASRQSGRGASSSVDEHKTLTGEFAAHRGAGSMNGANVGPMAATASADKLSGDSGTLPSPQTMTRTAHEAVVAGGVSAAAGQGIGTHVVVGQTSVPEASAWVRDPGNVHGTAGATAAAPGNSAAAQPAGPQATFAALDAGTAVGTPSWIHAGGRQAEAGFQDPALGWVGVRADLSGGSVHAALVPGSTEAAQALSGHLAGLSAYLQEQQTPVATLTMAAPGTSGMEAGVDQSMQQSAGQHGDQNPPAATQSSAQPGADASAPATAMSATATNAAFNVIAYAEGSRGTHISVMV